MEGGPFRAPGPQMSGRSLAAPPPPPTRSGNNYSFLPTIIQPFPLVNRGDITVPDPPTTRQLFQISQFYCGLNTNNKISGLAIAGLGGTPAGSYFRFTYGLKAGEFVTSNKITNSAADTDIQTFSTPIIPAEKILQFSWAKQDGNTDQSTDQPSTAPGSALITQVPGDWVAHINPYISYYGKQATQYDLFNSFEELVIAFWWPGTDTLGVSPSSIILDYYPGDTASGEFILWTLRGSGNVAAGYTYNNQIEFNTTKMPAGGSVLILDAHNGQVGILFTTSTTFSLCFVFPKSTTQKKTVMFLTPYQNWRGSKPIVDSGYTPFYYPGTDVFGGAQPEFHVTYFRYIIILPADYTFSITSPDNHVIYSSISGTDISANLGNVLHLQMPAPTTTTPYPKEMSLLHFNYTPVVNNPVVPVATVFTVTIVN